MMALTREELLAYAKAHTDIGDACDVLEADCDIIEYMMDHCEITVGEANSYFVHVNCGGILAEITRARRLAFKPQIAAHGLTAGHEALAFTGGCDFGHTTPEWESVISLGLVGLKERVLRYAALHGSDPKSARFYRQVVRVYDAALRFLSRAAKVAQEHGKPEMAKGLAALTVRAPENLFEAMQMSIGYYVLQHMFEGTYLRTLGRLDALFYPFFVKEERARAEQLVLDYYKEIDALEAPANMPFAIGGTDSEGGCAVNELSCLLLETYKIAGTQNTKLHLLCADNTSNDLLESAFRGVREGNNSLVFMSDGKIIEALERLGAAHEDAVNYHIVGCYECGASNEIASSGNGRVNVQKGLEYALNGGRDLVTGALVGLETESDFATYEQLYAEFARQTAHLCRSAMLTTDLYEAHYSKMHASPLLSSTYASALENGGDVYCDYAARYNSSSINVIGLATVVDSLAAIKKLVFEDKTVTLARLREILRADWAGEEALRLLIKNKFPKFGIGDGKTDEIARNVVDTLADVINGAPNVKGGKYRLGLISINWRWSFGEKTGASADGRHAGDTLSQNASATFGAEREGATAHLISTAAIDYGRVANGTVVDIDLHASAVRGENGIKTLVATLKTHFELGGFAVHYNVLDTETLKDARLHPEKYPNLQVRLCGWNVLFSLLSDKEKDEFIARSVGA